MGSLTESCAFVIFGASGDLAKRKIYPTLWLLCRDNSIPKDTVFFGYARSDLTKDQVRERCSPFMKVSSEDQDSYEDFWRRNLYLRGSYDKRSDFETLNELINKTVGPGANRLFYLAVLPTVFESVTSNLKGCCMAGEEEGAWTRIVIEKPFGKDSESSDKLSRHVASLFPEEELFRIDHYLGKEMVQNLMLVR
ncbi:glucose-6-phosphate 1-dehydrogenase-like [Macrobrachium rosenbergii]|uniref:glucose-6-phosphate 1-dehydrogenase-like n=1 Tax=Macrobrachium rosenbergii TaxID=79674 RepID=UPI0034D60766